MEHQQKRTKKEEEEREINELLYSIMDGYSDKVIAPLSQFSALMKEAAGVVEAKGSSSKKRCRPKEANEEVTESLKKEREKRDKMAENYDLLLSMVPNLFPKATRENIVGETIAYIQSLEKEIKRLEELKNSSESKVAEGYSISNRNSSINVTVSSNLAFFGIQSLVRPRLVTDIFMVFHKHKAEVLAANVAVNDQRQITVTVTAAVANGNGDSTIEKIKRDILIL
ncbi:transcription factor bHLH13-like [Durio zibethinus]|uniref:Transcription factor bHLH13-like n=1 Tax=Durio zibethinus TaxID=66656 RepID=A0A6P6A6B3_DURZI|nr:transcription factor bHLH13-like [Durio zibethinus]